MKVRRKNTSYNKLKLDKETKEAIRVYLSIKKELLKDCK